MGDCHAVPECAEPTLFARNSCLISVMMLLRLTLGKCLAAFRMFLYKCSVGVDIVRGYQGKAPCRLLENRLLLLVAAVSTAVLMEAR